MIHLFSYERKLELPGSGSQAGAWEPANILEKMATPCSVKIF